MAHRGASGRPARSAEAGITLIEMLVVLSIIAVAAGTAMLRFPASGGNSPASEAAALALAVTTAADLALTSGRPRAIDWTARSYRMLEWLPGNGWQAVAGTERQLGSAAPLRGPAAVDAARLILGTDALNPAAEFVIGTDDAWRVAFDGLAARALPGASP